MSATAGVWIVQKDALSVLSFAAFVFAFYIVDLDADM